MNERLSDLFSSRALRARWQKEKASDASVPSRTGADPVTSSLNDPIVDAMQAHVSDLKKRIEGRLAGPAVDGVNALVKNLEQCLTRPESREFETEPRDGVADQEHGAEPELWRPDVDALNAAINDLDEILEVHLLIGRKRRRGR